MVWIVPYMCPREEIDARREDAGAPSVHLAQSGHRDPRGGRAGVRVSVATARRRSAHRRHAGARCCCSWPSSAATCWTAGWPAASNAPASSGASWITAPIFSSSCFALGWFAAWGWVTWWLPAAIAWAFGLYAFDSWWRSGELGRQRRLLGSRLGHVGGILNYAAVGGVMAEPALGLSLVPRPLGQAALVAVMGVAFVSGLERLLLLWLGRGFSGPVAENISRSGCSAS